MTFHYVQAVWFLLSTLLTLIALLGIFRAAADLGRIPYTHPFMQFLARWTPPRRSRAQLGRGPAFNWLAWGWAVVFMLLLVSLRDLLLDHQQLSLPVLILHAIFATIHLTLIFYILVILLAVLSRWSSIGDTRVLDALANTLILPVRRLVPQRTGVDLVPLVVLLILMTMLVLLPRG